MTQGIALIVGLGNPGPEYAETRHNAGFRFLEAVLAHAGGSLRDEARFLGRVGRINIAGCEVWLLAPSTFMNHSGQAVTKLARYYRISTPQILVVHDEIDLPLGTLRLKLGGGDGGHNGVHDVAEQLGSSDFVRLRIGVGRPGPGLDGTAYVLRRAPEAEQKLIDDSIESGRLYLEDMVTGQYQRVMNALHAPTETD
ncbi:MAG: aminoacyl-tRNA hydrolase [Acidiferrobacterales bacterium]